jgi:2-hydroxychromene-2-carboxylate isomerase
VGGESITVIIYADFSCLHSYLASHRVDALAEVGARVEWRAIERDPSLSVTGRRLGGGGELEHQLTQLLRPGERLPWRIPVFVRATEVAVTGYSEAYGAGVAVQVGRVLFVAYWVQGVDIGSAEVLRRLLAGPIRRGCAQQGHCT